MAEDQRDFLEQQRRAVERMNEMYRMQQMNSVSHKMPAAPDFVKVNTEHSNNRNNVANKKANNDFHNTNEKNAREQPKINVDNNPPKKQNKTNQNHGILGGILGGINLPFKNGGKLDGDITLILGLLLILASEKADRKLLLALLYILM